MVESRRWTDHLDRFDHLVALLDSEGQITFVNRAWSEFAEANAYAGPAFTDVNYLQVCDQAVAAGSAGAAAAREVLRGVVEGMPTTTQIKLPCHSPAEHRWFTAWFRCLSGKPCSAVAMVGFRDTTNEHLAGVQSRRFEFCSACRLEIPLLRPEAYEVPQDWICKFCGNRYAAVFDDLCSARCSTNVARV